MQGVRGSHCGHGPIVGTVLAIAALALAMPGVAVGQALDVSNVVDLTVQVTADREGCTLPHCVRLRISVQNLAATERFVPRALVDARRLRLSAGDRELRVVPRSGTGQSDVRERLDRYGGSKDSLVGEYRLPSCCTVLAGAEPLDALPPGRYTVTYEGAIPSTGGLGDSKEAPLRSTPILFMIRNPAGADAVH
jgi:hypothetical protein